MEKNYSKTLSLRTNRPRLLKKLLTTLAFCSVLFVAQTGFSQISYNYGWEPTGLGGWVATGASGNFSRNTNSPCTGAASVRANNYFASNSIFRSPALTGTNGGDITLQFNYKIVTYSDVSIGSLLADIGTIKIEHATAAGGPWSTISTISSTNHIVSATCATKTVVKTGVSATGNNFFRFVAQASSTGDNYVYIDDIVITQGAPPTCLAPSALTINNLTLTSATLAWTEQGTATDWDVEYGIAGFTPTGTPNVASTTNPTPISSLTPYTGYEFYVRSVCSGSDMSTWSGPYYFYTGYCAVSVGSNSDYTSNFSTSTAVNNVTYTASSNPAGSYSDQTAQVFTSFPTQEIQFSHSYVGGNNSYKVWVDWNGDLDFDDAGEEMSSYLGVSSPHNGSFTVPAVTTPGVYAVRVRSVYDFSGSVNVTPCGNQSYGTTINFSLNVTAPPSCMPPSALTAAGITPYTADLSWTENGTATEWDIEYGLAGFTPTGTPTQAGVTLNPVGLTALNPSSVYNFYVRAVCSTTDVSTWTGPFSFTTLCAPISALPWTENFDNMTTVDSDLFPPCWVAETTFEWSTDNSATSTFNAGPLSPSNYLLAGYDSDSKIWTPEFNLVAGETYEFGFNWAGDGATSWEGSVFVNTTQSSTGATALGTSFIEAGDANSLTYKKEVYCFTPTVSGVYTFGVYVMDDGSDFSSDVLSFDDFSLKQVVAAPGVDGSLTTCQIGSPVDLNTVITTTVTDGTWIFDINPNAVNVNMFNTTNLASGTYDVLYVVGGCIPDTTVATITVVQPSSAGSDGSIAVCRNQPFNLLSGLVGNANLGGVWTNPNAVVVPNGNAIASNIPGQYNYKYIVSNGVCPADTAKVVVNVQGCDYLGLEDVVFEGFKMYPNPTSDIVFISNTGSTEVFNYEVLDMNGRVILKANQAINGSTTTELDLSKVEVGVYMVRVFNENADKTFRVVKN